MNRGLTDIRPNFQPDVTTRTRYSKIHRDRVIVSGWPGSWAGSPVSLPPRRHSHHLAGHYLLLERISLTKSSPLCIRSSFPSFRTPFYHSGHNRAIPPSTLSSHHLHHVAAGTRIIPVCSEMMRRQGDYFSTSVTFLYGLISFGNRT